MHPLYAKADSMNSRSLTEFRGLPCKAQTNHEHKITKVTKDQSQVQNTVRRSNGLTLHGFDLARAVR